MRQNPYFHTAGPSLPQNDFAPLILFFFLLIVFAAIPPTVYIGGELTFYVGGELTFFCFYHARVCVVIHIRKIKIQEFYKTDLNRPVGVPVLWEGR